MIYETPSKSKCLVASFGFDEKFPLRALIDTKASTIYAVGLYTDPNAWTRLKTAFHRLQTTAANLGVEAELLQIDYRGEQLPELVYKLKKILEETLETCNETIVSLTGGPRILVVALLLATQTLDIETKLRIRVEGEGFEAVVEEDIENLKPVQLDKTTKNTLRLLVEAATKKQPLGPKEISKTLNLPKSTAHKKLQDLTKRNLAEKLPKTGKYKPTPKGILNA